MMRVIEIQEIQEMTEFSAKACLLSMQNFVIRRKDRMMMAYRG